eukprot:TRINITY_DN60863_c0_g1_i1.p2 TRINITY_DN60863_c0_g1~~TRINITY_DN60863_c0_g1_i1.p2  ORF type:complete len:210 (+),score=23.25 TRINITY_DN60863_c0_g1_i1:29-631(+)
MNSGKLSKKAAVRDLGPKGCGIIAVECITAQNTILARCKPLVIAMTQWDVVLNLLRDGTSSVTSALQLAGGKQEVEVSANAMAEALDVDPGIEEKVVRQLFSVVRTNALEISGEMVGLFLNFSRFNHSCDPNCELVVKTGMGTDSVEIFTTKNVSAGEELTISYLGAVVQAKLSPMQRRRHLQERWGFDCTCTLCTAQQA